MVKVDASDIALGTVLSQKSVDEEIHPIYYWSQQLAMAERNYSTTDRECLAIVAACQKFHPYVLGGRIKIIGNHTAIK
jgi:L-lysine 2,3-aminomutase